MNVGKCGRTEKPGDILGYRVSPREGEIANPFLREVLDIIGGDDAAARLADARSGLVERYSFSIPTFVILTKIAACSPLVEIGAGSGYWAMCLSQCGADVAAFDKYPPGEAAPWDICARNRWFEDTWHHVNEGDETAAALYPERSLFLCWPQPESPMAYRALTLYLEAGGSRVIYIGDPASSGDRAFHELLGTLVRLECIEIPGLPGISELCIIAGAG